MTPAARDRTGRPRLLFLIGGLGPGGAEIQARYLLTGLPSLGIDVRLACFGGYDGEMDRVREAGVPIVILRPRPRRLWAARVLWDILRIIRRDRVEIVQTFLPSFDILAGFLRLTVPRVRIATSRRTLDSLLSERHVRMLRWSGRFVDAIVANSKAVAGSVERYEAFTVPKVRVIPNGVPLPETITPEEKAVARSSYGLDPNAFVIAFLAHFRPEKGYRLLPRVLRALVDRVPQAHLLVAGDMELYEGYKRTAMEFRTQVEELGIAGRAHCLGPTRDVRAVLAASDVLLSLSDIEGMSNSIMEAMAHGVPVVATRVGGTVELIEDGHEGWLIPAGGVSEAVDRLVMLAGCQDAAKSAGAAGRRRIDEEFSVDRMIRGYASLYDQLLGSGIAEGSATGSPCMSW